MEDPTDLQYWEFLSEPEAPVSNPALDDVDSEDGVIKTDYFSLNPIKTHAIQPEEEIDEGGIDSDNPSWIDPDSDARYQSNARSFLSDESSEDREELGAEKKEEELGKGEGSEGYVNGERVWWKMPLQVLKVWVFRASPVWSISIAAAIIGVVMLGRRLYKMKQKGRSIPLKLAIDDKKASQFMARAARLNEAFSVVKWVPIIRPALPAGSGITSWPMASLR